MQARFLRLAERISSTGLESLSEPHVKHLEGKLWELRLTGRDGIARALYVTATGRRVVVVRPGYVRRATTLSSGRERIEQRHASNGNIRDIAGHQCQSVHLGGGRQEPVDQR